ncbi:MAG: nuclear transport factor 2 family protein [Bacteroidota bacterium]
MRYFVKTLSRIVILIFIFNFSKANIITAQSHTARAENELLEAVGKFNKAFAEGDLETLKSMVTDNYAHTNGNSKSIDKESWFNYLQKRRKEIQSGVLVVVDYKMDEVEIEFYENTAILTAKVVTSVLKEGATIENSYRVTNIWVNENGNWMRAGFHDTKIK